MKRAAFLMAFVVLASCSSSEAERTARVWGERINSANEQDYSRKADSALIRSKEIRSGSECVGYDLGGICHGTVIRNE
jgi:hypothetical protein